MNSSEQRLTASSQSLWLLDEISRVTIYQDVPHAELHQLSHVLRPLRIEETNVRYFEPATEQRYMLPISGELVLIRDHLNQSRPFCLRLRQGCLWPIQIGNAETAVGVQALVGGTLGVMTSHDLHQIIRQTVRLRFALYQALTLGWDSIVDEASRKVNLPLLSQLARLFLDFRVGENGRDVVRLSHWQIALLLNSHRETISTEMGKMRQLGLIQTARKEIFLLNLPLLTKLGNDELKV